MSSKLYSVIEAAKETGLTRQAIHEAITSKRLKATRQTVKRLVPKRMTITVIAEADLQEFKALISRSHQERGFLKTESA